MSIRELPVSNRYLDLKEKEKAYQKHLKALVSSKATIDMSRPETPGRINYAKQCTQKYRKEMKAMLSKREEIIKQEKTPRSGTVLDKNSNENSDRIRKRPETSRGPKLDTLNIINPKLDFDMPIIFSKNKNSDYSPFRSNRYENSQKYTNETILFGPKEDDPNKVVVQTRIQSEDKTKKEEIIEDEIIESKNDKVNENLVGYQEDMSKKIFDDDHSIDPIEDTKSTDF